MAASCSCGAAVWRRDWHGYGMKALAIPRMICTIYSSAFELVDVRYRIMSPVPSIWRQKPATKNHLRVRSFAARREAPIPMKTPAALGQVVMFVAVLVDFCTNQRLVRAEQEQHSHPQRRLERCTGIGR
jgi:hypothetical protein